MTLYRFLGNPVLFEGSIFWREGCISATYYYLARNWYSVESFCGDFIQLPRSWKDIKGEDTVCYSVSEADEKKLSF